MESPLEYLLLQDPYPRAEIEPYDAYRVLYEGQLIGQLSVVEEEKTKLPWVETCLEQHAADGFEWSEQETNVFLKLERNYCLRLIVTNSVASFDPELIELL